MKEFFRKPEALWWLASGLLAIVIVLLLARRLMGLAGWWS